MILLAEWLRIGLIIACSIVAGMTLAWLVSESIRLARIRRAIRKQRDREDRIFAANLRAVFREQERHLCRR